MVKVSHTDLLMDYFVKIIDDDDDGGFSNEVKCYFDTEPVLMWSIVGVFLATLSFCLSGCLCCFCAMYYRQK